MMNNHEHALPQAEIRKIRSYHIEFLARKTDCVKDLFLQFLKYADLFYGITHIWDANRQSATANKIK